MRTLLSRFWSLLRRRTLDQRLDEELRFHLEMETEANRRRGMRSEQAACAAKRAFGGAEQIKEIYRERRGFPGIEALFKDVGYALRMLRRTPTVTAVAILSLALGIGANTAIFTLIDAVMLRSLPVRSPGELVSVGDASRPTALWYGGPMVNIFSYPLYRRVRDHNGVFSGLLASGQARHVEMTAGESTPEPIRGRFVSTNYFEVLGVSPMLGRIFSPESRTVGASPVIVISYDFWKNRFAGDPDVLGGTVRLNGSPFTIIGIGPPHFTGEVVGSPTDIWIPLSMQAQVNPGHPRLDRRDANWLLCLGRLKPGVSIAQARAEVTALVHQALIDYEGAVLSPARSREIRREPVYVEPGAKGFSWIRSHDSLLLFTLMAVAGLVLLIACANIANLLLARASVRQREICVRVALGASRWRVMRQMLTESALLAAIGGAAGLLMAAWGSRIVPRLLSHGGPNAVPFQVDVHLNGTVLGFALVISILTVVLFGLAPALRSTRVDLTSTLKENTPSLSQSRWQLGKALVIGQVALSLLLLIGAGLLIRSLINLETMSVGYSQPNHLLLLQVDPAASAFGMRRQLPLMRSLIERLRSVPGVGDVTASANGLFTGIDSSGPVRVEGFTPTRKQDMQCAFDQVGPRYFQVLGAPILAGRGFDTHDEVGAPKVAIVNERMARFYFGESNPIGKSILNGNDRYTIVGVVADMREGDLKEKAKRRVYTPLLQTTDRIDPLNFEIRTRIDAARLVPTLRRDLREFNRNLKVPSIAPVRLLIDQSFGGERTIAQLCAGFSILALFLAVIGLYGVMAYATSRRGKEIAVRMALGAGRGEVIHMILGETVMLIAAGFALGIPAALAATRLTSAFLVGVGASDPTTIAAAALVMLVAGVLAGFIPALRASRIDPMIALRQQ